MSEAAPRAAGRRALVRALLVGLAVAGLVGGWTAGSGLVAHTSVPSGQVLATNGTIIVEN